MDGEGAGHEWLVEFERPPMDMDSFVQILDDTLKQVNSDYEAKRYRNLALGSPIVRVLPSGSFAYWLKTKGKLGGQHKVPRLSNTREYVDDLMSVLNNMA